MASSVGDLGRKLVDRAETVVRDDWEEGKKRAKGWARGFGYRGSSKKARKSASRGSNR